MQIQPFSGGGYQAVGVSMGLLIEKALAVNFAALAEHVSICISRFKFHPALIKIALLRNQAVADPAVGQQYAHCHRISRRQGELLLLDRRNQSSIILSDR